jgi:hypothetical protein
MPIDDFRRFSGDIVENGGELVNYTLAHNIIYAGLEYAADYGFQPHKDFNPVTRHLLEEDTDEIELIDIECGMDGKPTAFRGPHDTDLKFLNIVKRLEQTAGKGNFYIFDAKEIEEDDETTDHEDEWDEELDGDSVENNDEDHDYSGEFENLSIDEKIALYKSLVGNFPFSMDGDEVIRFAQLTDSIFDEIIDNRDYKKFFAELIDDFDIEIESDTIPDQFFTNDGTRVPEDFKEHYLYVYDTAFDDLREARKEFKIFDKFARKQPYCAYLDLSIHMLDHSRKYPSLLKEYAQKFPDYPPIRISWLSERIRSGSKPEEFTEYPFKLKNFFPGRSSLHESEIREYLLLLLYAWMIKMDYSRLTALENAMIVSEIPDNIIVPIKTSISLFKMTSLQEMVKTGKLSF